MFLALRGLFVIHAVQCTTVEEWRSFDYEGTAGERSDVVITLMLHGLEEFADISRSRVQALIEQGGVLYDGKEVLGGWKNMRPGMRLEINLGLLRQLVHPTGLEGVEPVEMQLKFLHIDEHLAVVVKRVGISVHPSPTDPNVSLASGLLFHLGELSDAGGADRPGIVHRLDHETSGVLVIARNNPAHVALARQFHDRLVEKEYQALVIDAPVEQAGRIELPIGRHPANRQRMTALPKHLDGLGREALSEYRIAGHWGPLTLLDVAIHTGRTHQIRVHLLAVGATILNDDKYGRARNSTLLRFLETGQDRSAKRSWHNTWPTPEKRAAMLALLQEYNGIFLHSRRLAFTHPVTGERMEFEEPPPQQWEDVRVLATPPEEPEVPEC